MRALRAAASKYPTDTFFDVVRALPSAYPDDASLVAALVARQPAAGAAAWDRFSPLVRGVLWQSLGVGAEVDDLAQDVFLHFFRRIADLREPNAVSGFVVGITVRVARGELRRRRLRRWLSLSGDGTLPEVAAPAVDARGDRCLEAFLDPAQGAANEPAKKAAKGAAEDGSS
jgi:RNA polymerase sigma-70 factor (ECF subfamily)